tara:strand:+ start:1523 stop:2389 length:867 start_codon:yes stop_codon:yes gene_type:complete
MIIDNMNAIIEKAKVKVMAFYLDSLNYFSLVKAKLKRKRIVYSHYARVNNFGDRFNKDLVRFFDAELIYVSSYKKSEMALTGSILGAYLRDFSGYIVGAGFILERYNRLNNNWKVKLIRGPLSAKQCGATAGVVYGDPGILASQIYTINKNKKYKLGILPHSRDVSIVKDIGFDKEILIIHPRRKPSEVAKDIQQCEFIASSSLHGLIFADSFRIPNIHIKFSDNVIGGLHKFNDYYLGMEATPDFINFSSNTTINNIIEKCSLRYSEAYLVSRQKEIKDIIHTTIYN